MNVPPRILIAGVGNIFLGDDAFGCEVVRRLAGRAWPENIRVIEFGIRGVDLAYALLDGYDVTILVDAVARGSEQGTLFVIQPQVDASAAANPSLIDAHTMDPGKVVRMVQALGGHIDDLILIGCEPTRFDPELDIQAELSEPVRQAIEPATELIVSLVNRICEGTWGGARGLTDLFQESARENPDANVGVTI
jgi:hydrogenase maturation protease